MLSLNYVAHTVLIVIDPLGQHTVKAGRDNCFCTCCPLAHPNFSKSSKTKPTEKNVCYW